ncbi:MAG: cell division protein ZipA [Proteobacteria bacterium]|nr:cell division protein ZipA [Pseudomonadota bacterium]
MELAQLTIRDWMVVAGVLLIFAVLLDAYRRVRKERNASVRLKLADPDERDSAREVDLAWLKELPNGGARVVGRSDTMSAAQAQLDESVEDITEQQAEPGSSPAEPEEVELVSMSAGQEPENIDWLDSLDTQDIGSQEKPAQSTLEEPRLPRQLDPEVFMLNVVARSPAGFNGGDILHILLACDLRFGDMSFFHRYEHEAGLGSIQFSVANMMQPGVFDLDDMADMNTPGLVFFLTLPGPEDMMQAFDYMFETAQAVARNLEGDVLDESRSAMTSQTLEHSRQKIRDLERRMLTQAER